MIFFILFSSIGWCYISVSVSPIYFHTHKINDSFEILLNNQGDEPIRLSFFVNDLATKSIVRYVHFVLGNTFFLNIGESLTVPIEFSFDQSTANLSNNFPIIMKFSLKNRTVVLNRNFVCFLYFWDNSCHSCGSRWGWMSCLPHLTLSHRGRGNEYPF